MRIHNGRNFIRQIERHPEHFHMIHYSCRGLYDDNDALSPCITSIAITHYATQQTVSFSNHSIAEELHIPRKDIQGRSDEVELQLLQEFRTFIHDGQDKC